MVISVKFSMKKIIAFILILSSAAVLFCGCGKKDKDTAGSKSDGSTTSQSSEGIDVVTVDDMDETAVEIDFETGSIISLPSDKSNSSSSSEVSETIGEAGTSDSNSSNTSSGSSSSSSSSSGSSSEASNSSSGSSSEEDGMGGFNPWE